MEYQALWRTYVYQNEPEIEKGFLPNNFTHYRNPEMENPKRYELHKKVIASKYLLNEKQAVFSYGSHFLIYPHEYHNNVKKEIHDKLVFAHFPVRSKAQILKKAVPNWIHKWKMNPLMARNRDEFDAFQLSVLFNELRDSGEMTFTPASGMCSWDPPEYDSVLGQKISPLPNQPSYPPRKPDRPRSRQ